METPPTRLPWHELNDEPASRPTDHGEEVLDLLQEQLQIDDEWVDRSNRTLTWWGANNPLIIHVSEPRIAQGDPVVKVTADHLVSERVGLSFDAACKRAFAMNPVTNGMALWVDPGSLALHNTATFYAHPGNQSILDNKVVATVFLLGYGASVIQTPDLLEAFDALPRVVPHPLSGLRTDMDELIFYPLTLSSHPKVQNMWNTIGVLDALEMFLQQGLFSNGDETGLTTEFPFASDVPASMQAGLGFGAGGMTSLYRQTLDDPHPFMGAGLSSRLRLPPHFERDTIAVLANGLNWAEANEMTGFPSWGAWTSLLSPEAGELDHVFHSPGAMARWGLASVIGFSSGLRSMWAQERLLDEELVASVRRGGDPG